MTVILNSYVHCNGNAREALEFYKSVFGGEISMSTFADYTMPVPEDEQQHIMHGLLKGDNGIQLMVSDAPTSMPQPGSSDGRLSLTLSGDDEAVLRGYWEKLSEGATVTAPLEPSPWGDVFGMLTDKYGVEWMVDVATLAS